MRLQNCKPEADVHVFGYFSDHRCYCGKKWDPAYLRSLPWWKKLLRLR